VYPQYDTILIVKDMILYQCVMESGGLKYIPHFIAQVKSVLTLFASQKDQNVVPEECKL
jgi:hypothetical protein